ncbi:MAG TPA: hypothetical protein VIZ18_06680 [Ktedonobacteraceae bacterium]
MEEMNDSAIEQALVSAASRGVQIEIILPAPSGSSSDSNSQGIAAIKQSNITVREDPQSMRVEITTELIATLREEHIRVPNIERICN